MKSWTFRLGKTETSKNNLKKLKEEKTNIYCENWNNGIQNREFDHIWLPKDNISSIWMKYY